MRRTLICLACVVAVMLSIHCSGGGDDGVKPKSTCSDYDNFSCAKSISIGESATERISFAKDQDFFKFTIAQAGVIQVSVDPVPSEIRMDVYVYDAQQVQIDHQTAGTKGQGVFRYLLRGAGTYYVRVRDYYNTASSADSYTLLVELDASDTHELNNDFGDASLIALNTDAQGKIKPAGDQDFFKFTIAQAGVIQVSVDPVPSEIRMDAYVYDEQQVQIDHQTAAAKGQGVFRYVLRDAGTYYVRVRDYYNTASSEDYYTLLVELDASDTHELNNAFSDASMIALNTDVQGKIRPAADQDFFKFTIAQAGVIQVSVDPVPSEIRMDVYVYDEQQVQVGHQTAGTRGQAISLSASLSVGGTYYVRLRDYYNDAASGDYYTLRVAQ